MDFRNKLFTKVKDLNIILNDNQLTQFERYYRMLVEKNKVMNLTAITEEDEVIDKHFVDSLTCVRIIDMNQITNMIDIGTGAGFPGLPIKIAFPDINITLLDSLNKRIRFIEEVIEETGLNNIQTLHGRAEDYARKKEYRDQYDLCVSRAVANLRTLSEYCIPFLKEKGYFVSYKSKKGLEEIQEVDHCMKLLDSNITHIEEFSLSDQEFERLLIKIQKNKKTNKKYPRKAGIPLRNPL